MSTLKHLNINGVSYDIGAPITTWYGTSDSGTYMVTKAVTCSGFELVEGAIITVLFSNTHLGTAFSLNVNSTGAKEVRINGNSIDYTNTLRWNANTLVVFLYDGTYFEYLFSQVSASTAPPDGAGTCYGTSSSSASTGTKTSSISNFRLLTGAIVSITFTYANTYTSDALTLNITSTGAKTIYVNNSATSSSNTLLWEAGETLTFIYSGSYWYFLAKSSKLDNFVKFNKTSLDIPTMSLTTNGRIAIQDSQIDDTMTDLPQPDIDSTSNVITFSSSDTTTDLASGWTEIYPLTSGESHGSLFAKISTLFKNVRALWNYIKSNKYASGDVENFQAEVPTTIAINVPMLLTSALKSIFFTINTPKSLENITSVNVTGMIGGIRPATGGYINGSSDTYDWLTDNTLDEITVKIINDHTLTVIMSFSTALTGTTTNNIPAAGLLRQLEFTFT